MRSRDLVPEPLCMGGVRGGTGCAGRRVSDRSSGTAFRSRGQDRKEGGRRRTDGTKVRGGLTQKVTWGRKQPASSTLARWHTWLVWRLGVSAKGQRLLAAGMLAAVRRSQALRGPVRGQTMGL